MVNPGVCGTLNLGSIPRGGTKKMKKEEKLIPGLPSGLKIDGINNYCSKRNYLR